ncbi:Phytoene desaturase (neurosporene-forming) [Stieleria bergensis]|uniref:Phytoene desaturase (Neurosporene-forming) n=1 Tax=Stieleria bergensis TaxID=2528025 RepID=A0A517SZ46_9BACT|nr:Phytoene desaturase (neurosporene-forming) [Planctomycetes bacterium SV_7m_r]
MKEQWDVIVIGSGMGGMVTAAALSKLGHKVLMLEQYKELGGQTHSFSREGFSWDAGIHYLGGFGPDFSQKAMLDWLCDSPIELAPMGAIYDTLHMGDSAPLPLSRPTVAQRMDLKERFPEDTNAIDAWFDAIVEGREAMTAVIQGRPMPSVFASALKWWRSNRIQNYCGRTTAEVVNDLTDNRELANVLMAQWADFGGRPSTASFAMHACVMQSYLESGAYYPVGGASSIAEHMLPTITGNGGEARAGVEVRSLVMEDENVTGVETADGETLLAKHIVSDIGARETVDRLLPDGHGHLDWVDEIRAIGPNICHYSLFLGFAGDVEAAGMTKSNHWLYPTGEVDAVWTNIPDDPPPGMFVSFASMKDPAHNPGPENKYAGELMVWSDWSTVQEWAGVASDKRGEDYRSFKRKTEAALLDHFAKYFPRLAKLVVFHELSTPLATASITGHRMGSFYGLDVTPARFMTDALRMKTPVEGLYLTGQDVVTPGIPGAFWGGFLCAGSIEPQVFLHMNG